MRMGVYNFHGAKIISIFKARLFNSGLHVHLGGENSGNPF
jgi:hypothetical protein